MKKLFLLTVCSLSIIALAACKKKGPAEKTGEKVDEAIESVKDAVNPKGPAEKAGEKVDEVLGK
jgi:predicted small lipoprotein YifL